jgi:hypothetical protein
MGDTDGNTINVNRVIDDGNLAHAAERDQRAGELL